VDSNALLAWLRKGELEARAIACKPFKSAGFREALARIRELTLQPLDAAIPATVRLCAESGVALVFVQELPKTRTWGATRWLTPEKALIQLSARGKTDDQIWFTFFHEAGHILLHPKKDIFIELDDTVDTREDEADRFAADQLIPPNVWMLLRRMQPRSAADVQLFARQYGIAPGILVGRMQRENLIPWSHLNKLKTRLEFKP
jgi:Zn-dependent peptidase ImmA (M78 family)